jgi:hypothetical protein
MARALTIICHRDGGIIRGGRRHPKVAQHTLDDFTLAQLVEMLAEPELTLVLGPVATHADLFSTEESLPEKAEGGEKDTASQTTDVGQEGAGKAVPPAPSKASKAKG